MPRGVQFHSTSEPRVNVGGQTVKPHEDWHLYVFFAPGNYVFQVDFAWMEGCFDGWFVVGMS